MLLMRFGRACDFTGRVLARQPHTRAGPGAGPFFLLAFGEAHFREVLQGGESFLAAPSLI
jgi:hypothetical protein